MTDLVDLLLAQLAHASLIGGLMAAAVWALLRGFPRLPANAACALWLAVSLNFVVTLIWWAPVAVPLLPASSVSSTQAPASPEPERAVAGTSVPEAAPVLADEAPPALPLPGRAAGSIDRAPWRGALLLLWFCGVGLGLFSIGRELATVRRMLRESDPVTDSRVRGLPATVQRRIGSRREVALRVSAEIHAPLVTGWLRPVIVLPRRAVLACREAELSMLLAHELVHVRRWDLWTAWVPRAARCLFFFHPLALLAAREYAVAREAACDAAVVRELEAAPQDYARLLLWAAPRSPAENGEAIGWAPASSSFVHLKRRLQMLAQPRLASRPLRLTVWTLTFLSFLAAMPLQLTAQTSAVPVPNVPPQAAQAMRAGGAELSAQERFEQWEASLRSRIEETAWDEFDDQEWAELYRNRLLSTLEDEESRERVRRSFERSSVRSPLLEQFRVTWHSSTHPERIRHSSRMDRFLSGFQPGRWAFPDEDIEKILAHRADLEEARLEIYSRSNQRANELCRVHAQIEYDRLASGGIVDVIRERHQLSEQTERDFADFHDGLLAALSPQGRGILESWLASAEAVGNSGGSYIDWEALAIAYPVEAADMTSFHCSPYSGEVVIRELGRTQPDPESGISVFSMGTVPLEWTDPDWIDPSLSPSDEQ